MYLFILVWSFQSTLCFFLQNASLKNSTPKHRSFFVCFLHKKIVYWNFYILLLSLSLNLIARYQKVQLVVIFVFKSETHFRGHVKMKTFEKEIFLKVILQKPSEKIVWRIVIQNPSKENCFNYLRSKIIQKNSSSMSL